MSTEPHKESRRRRWTDVAAMGVVIAVVLPLYLATMYPDVLASGDSAKFQYLGSVLGTAHPPGYPFYVLLSYLFSFVPLGNLAWRMNFLSVVAAVLAALCTFASARRLGCGVAQAMLLALGLSTGLVFWNKSLAAEVYTIGALLLTLAIWRVLVWRETRADRDLLTAVAALSLGLGNHLTIAVVAPAFVLYVLLTDLPRAMRPRVLVLAATLIAAGLAQYGFIVLRTWQNAPYLEAQARSFADLLAVVRADKYSNAMFEFGWVDLVTERLPLIARQLLQELRPAGALLIVIGLSAAVWRARKEALLLAGSAGAILALTANVNADTAGFATPAFPPLWLLGAFAPGMQQRLEPRWRSAGSVAVTVLLLANVVAAVRGNFRFADHSDRTIERRLWSAVFEAVPDRTAILAESYVHDQGLLYMLVGEGVGRERGIELLPLDVPRIDAAFSEERRTIVAFDRAVRALRNSGFDFERLPLLDRPIPELIGASRRDRFVIAAVQPEATALLAAEAPNLMKRFGGTWMPERNPTRYAVVGVPRSGAAAVEARDAAEISLHVAEGQLVGPSASLPRPVHVRIVPGEIVVGVGAEEPWKTTAPFAVVILDDRGQVRGRLVPATATTLRPLLDQVPAYRLVTSTSCEDIGDRTWHDVSRVADRELLFQINNYRPHSARTTLYIAAETPPSLHLVETLGPEPAQMVVEKLEMRGRASRLAADGVVSPSLLNAAHVVRVELSVDDRGNQATVVLDVGAAVDELWARGEADLVSAPRVRACRRNTRGPAPQAR